MKKSYTLTPHPRRFYPYIIWFVALIFNFYKIPILIFPESIESYISESWLASQNRIKLLTVTALYITPIVQIPLGFFIDHYGSKKIGGSCIVIASLGVLIFSASHSYSIALLGRLFIGIGVSVAVINTLKLISNWFHPKNFALMSGITISTGMLGGYIYQLYFPYFFNTINWRPSLANLSLIGIIYALIYFILLRKNQFGINYNINPKIRKFSFSKSLKKCFKHPQTWLLTSFFAFVQAPLVLFLGIWGFSFLEVQYQFKAVEASKLVSLFFFGYMVSTPFIGFFSTKIKKRKPFIQIGASLLFICLFLLLFEVVNFNHLNWFLYLILGLTSGTFPLLFTMIHERNVPMITGTVIGLLQTGLIILTLIEFHITLFLIDRFGIKHSFLLLLVSVLIGVVFSFYIKETHAKQRILEAYRRK